MKLSFKHILSVVKKHNITLTRGGIVYDYPKCCPVAALAHDNKYTSYVNFVVDQDGKTQEKLHNLEAGFEGNGWMVNDKCNKYYLWGCKLAEYAGYAIK